MSIQWDPGKPLWRTGAAPERGDISSPTVYRVVRYCGLPIWTWLLITGATSSLATLGAVWAIWGS